MWIDRDGVVHQPKRKWYSLLETKEIYVNGGHIVLEIKEPTPRQKSLERRREGNRNG